MSGYITGDPYWLPEPEISFREATKMRLGGLRIAFATNLPPIGAAAPACQQAVLDTAQLLENLGHILEPVELDFTELIEPFTTVWQSAVAASGIPGELLEDVNRWFLARTVGAGLYLQAVSKMQMVARQIVGFFDNYDALLLPTNMSPAIRVGEWANLTPEERLPKIIEWVAPCPPFNATGQPAIAIPTGFTDHNLPVGVQIVGRPAQEIAIIALAAQIEAAQPWSDRRPTLAVE
jgi:amidase